jgi:hypothetical protein
MHRVNHQWALDVNQLHQLSAQACFANCGDVVFRWRARLAGLHASATMRQLILILIKVIWVESE